MSAYVGFFFQLRPFFMVAAAVLLFFVVHPRFRSRVLEFQLPPRSLLYASLTYFVLASLCKYTQLEARVLNGIDFWLFEDMFRFMAAGEPYITRFAPQAAGPVQHGSVHAFLSMWAVVPFVKIFGATAVAVLLVPVGLALGGYLIGVTVARSTTSSAFIVGLPVAFWMSEWTNRVLLYDTHPEAFYVPLVFGCYLVSVRLLESQTRRKWIEFLAVWTLLAAMKQDAIMYGCLLGLFLLVERKIRLIPAAAALALLIGGFGLMTKLIALFKSGTLGVPNVTIGSFPLLVTRPLVGAGGLNGHSLGGLHDLGGLLPALMPEGVWKFLSYGLVYLVASPFTMITLIAPWLWLRRSFWLMVIPPAILIGGLHNATNNMHTYKSMVFICFIWLAVATELGRLRVPRTWLVWGFAWTFIFCAVHGGASPTYYFTNAASAELRDEASAFLKDRKGLGIVSSRLLNDVDRSRVWSDQPPEDLVNPSYEVQWVLIPHGSQSFEFEMFNMPRWRDWALKNGWHLVEGHQLDFLVRD